MKEKTCCFTGHRKIPIKEYKHISKRLQTEIIKLIEKGVMYFGVGGALGFDTLAAQTILNLRNQYPQIKLILVLPCKNQTLNWKENDIIEYKRIKNACDKYVYVSESYSKECMYKRNRHLVDNSKYCICYLKFNTGGTSYTVKYAAQKQLSIINIAE